MYTLYACRYAHILNLFKKIFITITLFFVRIYTRKCKSINIKII